MMSIIWDMKPLILILLTAVWANAQTLVDLARQERARQAQIRNTRIYTNKDIKTTPQKSEEVTTPESAPEVPPAQPAPAPAEVAPDPALKWNEDMDKLRTKVRGLLDQETSAQLEINQLTNKFFAPVSSQSERAKVQSDLEVAQKQLSALRDDLKKNRADLEQRELQGPPRK